MFDHAGLNAAGDENDTGPPVVAWPVGQANRVVKDMLDAMNGDGLFFIDDADDTLYAQQIFTLVGDEGLDPGDEGRPFQGFVSRR